MAGSAHPTPAALPRVAAREGRGRLKIFLGAAPGVGKTYEMLSEGAERLSSGVDVLVAIAETHGRKETAALLAPLEIAPRRRIARRGRAGEEMDLDAVLARRPQLALVDELAHSNGEGSRHPKRWQDVAELLDAGIDVHTTLNVQNIESLNDVVASFTRVRVRETVPDSIFQDAEIELVDLPPDELIERLKAGKVHVPAEVSRSLGHYFSKANLSALREMALRRAALSVDQAMLEHLDAHALAGTYAAGERVLVAVSELPGSDALVRAGKRMADALRAPWQAVYIETPRAQTLDEAQKRRVAEALRLAASLGATIATVPAVSVIEGLRTHLQGMRATQLVIGKSVRSWWFELRHGSVVNAMLRAADGLAVHVIPASAAAPDRRRRLDLAQGWGSGRDYVLIALLCAVITGLGRLIEPLIGMGGIDLLFLMPVVVAADRFGLRPGLVTSVVAGLCYNVFLLPPLDTFTIADPRSLLTTLVLVGIAIFTANLAGRLKARAALGARSAQENAALAAFGQALARESTWDDTGRVVCTEMARLLDVQVLLIGHRGGALVTVASEPADLPALGPIDHAAADWAWSRGEPAGVGTTTLIAADWQFQPLRTALGVLALVALSRPDGRDPVPAGRAVLLATLLGQAALAHERLKLEDQMREVSLLRERDGLRAALLSSIGDDLRTPLAGVAAAVDALAAAPDPAAAAAARSEVARLGRTLDDLVEMVRIDTGAVRPELAPVELGAAIASAIDELDDLLRDRPVDRRLAPDLPPVRLDPALFHRILVNLLANAATRDGAGSIELIGERLPDAVRLSIRDRDAGLVPGDEGVDRSGGGLSLAVVKGLAEAMGLRLHAAAEQGVIFALDLPLDPAA